VKAPPGWCREIAEHVGHLLGCRARDQLLLAASLRAREVVAAGDDAGLRVELLEQTVAAMAYRTCWRRRPPWKIP